MVIWTRAGTPADVVAAVRPDVCLLIIVALAARPVWAVSDEQVARAVARMQRFLLAAQDPATGGWENRYGANLHHVGGETALVTLSLLVSGHTPQDPQIEKALRWLGQVQMNGTYAVSLRAHCWAMLPDRYLPQLELDAKWLLRAHRRSLFDYGPQRLTRVDHSVTQYGILGLWEYAKRGGKTVDAFWQDAVKHFLKAQKPDGGWGYNNIDHASPSTGSMTAAGLTILCVAQQELYKSHQRPPAEITAAIDHSIAWLNRWFTASENPNGGHKYYYLYAVERAALACGLQSLAGQDWFRAGAREILQVEQGQGSINNDLVQTAFALMFLARGRFPVWANKLRIPGANWNNRPNDIYFLTQYLSDRREQELNWQTVNIDSDPTRWLNSSITWLATDQPIELTDRQRANLKRYLDLGGLLIVNSDMGFGPVGRSIEKLAGQLYPQYPIRGIGPDHPAMNMVHDLSPAAHGWMKAVSNGARDLILVAMRDWGIRFQADSDTLGSGRTAPWRIMTNIHAMVAGHGDLANRLSNPLPARKSRPGTGVIKAVRAVLADAPGLEPLAWEPLNCHLFNRTGKELVVTAMPLEQVADSSAVLVHLAGVRAVDLSGAEQRAIRKFVEAGGTVLVETIGGKGEFSVRLEPQLRRLFGSPAVPIDAGSPIITGEGLAGGEDNRRVVYRPYSVIHVAPRTTSRLAAFVVNDRPAVIISYEDLSLAVLGVRHWGINGYNTESARRLVSNMLLAADSGAAARR